MVQQTDRTIYQPRHPSAKDSRKGTKRSANGAELHHQYSRDEIAPEAQAAFHHAKTDALDRHYSLAAPLPPMHRVNARDRAVEPDRDS
jgi:hypothetical protein